MHDPSILRHQAKAMEINAQNQDLIIYGLQHFLYCPLTNKQHLTYVPIYFRINAMGI